MGGIMGRGYTFRLSWRDKKIKSINKLKRVIFPGLSVGGLLHDWGVV